MRVPAAGSEFKVSNDTPATGEQPAEARDTLRIFDQDTFENASAITTASSFERWLMAQAVRHKGFGHTQTADRKTLFFLDARDAIGRAAMNPTERVKSLTALKNVENFLDQP